MMQGGRSMGQLRALLVEDSENDAMLVIHELRRCGFDLTYRRVETRDAMIAALRGDSWDLVISDYAMPAFDGLGALAVVRELGLDLPLIIVSGTIGEDSAVEALHAGAKDFLVKGKLSRLRPAIERELRERTSRAARREAEAGLRASELRFKRLWDSGIVGIIVADAAGAVVEANDTFLATVGYTRDDIASGGVDWASMTPEALRHLNASAIEQINTRGFAGPWETEHVRKNGSQVPVLVAVARLEGARNISISLDLSERKRLEEQFRHAQRMEAVGSLAGGVAHDFNNLLSVILSYTALILGGLTEGDPLRDDLEEVKKAGERAVSLTQQLLAFSRKQLLQPRVLDLNQVATGMERMLRRVLNEGIQLSLVSAHATRKVYLDQGQVEQILMNLIVNARDAMPDGGKIVLETKNADLDATSAAQHHGVSPGSYVVLTVTDSGTGMDAATSARIFEPFFTTKEQGKGTGLGLSTVYGIVKQSGGYIWVSSELGNGTTFEVYFPTTDVVPESVGTEPAAPTTLTGSETVLLVEDEDQVRIIMRTILRRHGYNVLEAQNAGEAFLICERFKAPIHLLVTDVVMPRVSGPELVARLAPTRPEMKILYVSGYTESSVVHEGVLDSSIAFLAKPITPDAFGRKVREVLDSSVGRA